MEFRLALSLQVAEDGLDPPASPQKCWDYRNKPPHPVIQYWAGWGGGPLYRTGKDSAN